MQIRNSGRIDLNKEVRKLKNCFWLKVSELEALGIDKVDLGPQPRCCSAVCTFAFYLTNLKIYGFCADDVTFTLSPPETSLSTPSTSCSAGTWRRRQQREFGDTSCSRPSQATTADGCHDNKSSSQEVNKHHEGGKTLSILFKALV